MKREVPLFVAAAGGFVMALSFFVPHQVVSVPADFLQTCVVVIVAFGAALGGANLVRVNLDAIAKRGPDWPYRLVLVVSLLAVVIIGAVDGARGGGAFLAPGTVSTWIYDHLYSPLTATVFALLAFFIASAAFRAFRIRTLGAVLLAAAALIVLLGRVPAGDVATGWLPEHFRLAAVQQWIMDVPQTAARRAIMIGAALGVMATGFRVILGLDRPATEPEE